MRYVKPLVLSAVFVLLSAAVAGAMHHAKNSISEADLRAYYEAWSKGDVDKVMSYFSDDIVYADVATGANNSGREAVRAFAQKFVDENPGVALTASSVTVAAKSAAVEWVMSGGTGDEAWSVPGVCVFKIADGKITHATDYWNKE